jgi:hypothetical protein
MPVALLALILVSVAVDAPAQERRNWFNDPFEQATRGLPGCPVPEGPLMTQAEQQREAHYRIERGTTCWLAKKCDEPNAYRSDPEINAAAAAALRARGELRDTSLWVFTQRRFVYVQGCVRDASQVKRAVDSIRSDPRVDHVIDSLRVGAHGAPPYPSAAAGN